MAYWVYILTNNHHTTLYVGVTNDILRRVEEHKSGDVPGFTAQYQCKKLVYAECILDPLTAIEREKQIKRWRREKKVALIESINPSWDDLPPA